MTDFAINTVNTKFENTDGGEGSIKKFFKVHKCNKICKILNLKWQTKFDDVK
jgi:hypothetical protein